MYYWQNVLSLASRDFWDLFWRFWWKD